MDKVLKKTYSHIKHLLINDFKKGIKTKVRHFRKNAIFRFEPNSIEKKNLNPVRMIKIEILPENCSLF